MDRRHFVVASTAFLAGCSGSDSNDGSGDGVKDSDGDGMVDSKDYAPNDAAVQEKSDVQSGSNNQSTPTDSPTDSPTDEPTPTEEPLQTVSYDETKHVPGPGYYQVELPFENQFTLNWTVTNQRSSDYDFDVFLFDEKEFQTYLDYANGESEHTPQYYTDGSAQGVTSSATRTAILSGGTYYLVVDNSDLGDAGDVGTEAGREVRMEIHAEEN